MPTILTDKDCEDVIDYIQGCQQSDRSLQLITPGVFDNFIIMRNMVFNSQLILISNDVGGKIDKLFATLTPQANTNDLSSVVTAFYADADFIKKCLETMKLLLDDDRCTKIKFIIDGHSMKKQLRDSVDGAGFTMEAHIRTRKIEQYIYSFYIK